MRKGVVTHLAVFTFIFIVSGQIYGAILTQDVFTEKIEYHTGGVNDIAEARIRGDLYMDRIATELNYSSNIVAVNVGENSGEADWTDNIPGKNSLRQEYESRVLDEIRTQNRVYGCEAPNIQDVVLLESYGLRLNFHDGQNAIKCSSRTSEAGTKAKVYLENNHVAVENPGNRYVPISEYAVDLAETAREKMPEEEVVGSDTEVSSCPGDKEATVSDAESNAKDEALQGYEYIASRAYSDSSGDRPSYIEANTVKTELNGGSSVSTTSTSCTYYVSCSKDLDGDGEPEITECSRSGEKYNATADYTLESIEVIYELQDSEKSVLTEEGGENIVFSFNYFNDLSK